MPDSHLWSALHADDVDERELRAVLGFYFKTSRQVDEDEILYGGKPDFAVKLIYKNDTLVAMDGGPGLDGRSVDELRNQIETDLLTPTGELTGRAILFSSLPVTGWWRHGDDFQILPPPQGAPVPSALLGEHPFIIEFRFRDSPNWQIRNLRALARERELGLILSVLLQGSVRVPDNVVRFHWVVCRGKDGEKGSVRYAQESYAVDGFQPKQPEFSGTAEVEPAESLEPNEYYTQMGIRLGQSLRVPTNLTISLGCYAGLAGKEKAQFMRACYWVHHASIAYSHSQSAAFLAVINAIEALVPPEKGAKKCPKCGLMKGKGPTQQFSDFVETYAPGSGREQRRKNLYRVRSALSHGGALLRWDLETPIGGLHPEWARQRQQQSEVWGIARIALINWLAAHQ